MRYTVTLNFEQEKENKPIKFRKLVNQELENNLVSVIRKKTKIIKIKNKDLYKIHIETEIPHDKEDIIEALVQATGN